MRSSFPIATLVLLLGSIQQSHAAPAKYEVQLQTQEYICESGCESGFHACMEIAGSAQTARSRCLLAETRCQVECTRPMSAFMLTDKFAREYASTGSHQARCKRMQGQAGQTMLMENCIDSLYEKRDKIIEKAMQGLDDRVIDTLSQFKVAPEQMRTILEKIEKDDRKRRKEIIKNLKSRREAVQELEKQFSEVDKLAQEMATEIRLVDLEAVPGHFEQERTEL